MSFIEATKEQAQDIWDKVKKVGEQGHEVEVRKLQQLREDLACFAHESWSGWQEYMFSKSCTNEDGSVTIPKDLVERWSRQMHTHYNDLPENEKESDRIEAEKMVNIFSEFLGALCDVWEEIKKDGETKE